MTKKQAWFCDVSTHHVLWISSWPANLALYASGGINGRLEGNRPAAVRSAKYHRTCSAAGSGDCSGEEVTTKYAMPPQVPVNQRKHQIASFAWRSIRPDVLSTYESDTAIFVDTWSSPAKSALSDIGPAKLQRYMRRFIRFKSVTNPRIEGDIERVRSPLSKTRDQSCSHTDSGALSVFETRDPDRLQSGMRQLDRPGPLEPIAQSNQFTTGDRLQAVQSGLTSCPTTATSGVL